MTLHVVNGSETTRLIEASGLPGRTLSWADSLYDGPVPDVSDEELVRIRAAFHDSPAHPLAGNIEGFTSWRAAVDNDDAYDELVLWFEHDLFDQLNLIHVLSYLGGAAALAKPVSLVSTDRFPGHPDFKGFGELEPADLAGLFAAREHVSERQIVLAKRAWKAYRSPDPRALEALLGGDTSALPFLAAALRRHLEEFPSDVGGLSRYEHRILDRAQAGPVTLRAAFSTIHEGERAYFLTDSSFHDRVTAMATTKPPLLTLTTDHAGSSDHFGATFGLTAAGHDVRSGKADRIRMCGIERWIGGVHLSGHGPLWRWSAKRGELIEA